MKIAVFTDPYLEVSGGIPSSIEAQKAELEKLGHEVVVFCPGHFSTDESIVIVPTCKHLRFGGAPLASWPGKIARWVEHNYPDFGQFDLVHVHYEAGCSLAGMMLARKYGLPLVQTMHGREDMAIAVNVVHPLKLFSARGLNVIHSRVVPRECKVPRDNYLAPSLTRAWMWTLMVNHANFADLVLTPTQHFADKLQHYGVKKPLKVLSNGIADEIYEQFPVRPRKWDGKKPLQMIWNSRTSREKRILPFLEALTGVEGDFVFHVFGEGNDYARAQDFMREHGLSDKVIFYGQQPREKIWKQLKKSHLSVINSYGFDTQGMILLEAEVAGVPVVFCDPDMRGVAPKGGEVFVDGPEPAKMTAALNDLWKHPERIERMSAAMFKGRDRLRQSKQAKTLLQNYKNLVK